MAKKKRKKDDFILNSVTMEVYALHCLIITWLVRVDMVLLVIIVKKVG